MLPVNRLIGHREWTDRKGDPRHSMDWRRACVAAFTPEDDMDFKTLMYDTKFRGNRNYAEVIHNIEDLGGQAVQQIAGLSAAVSKLAEVVAAGRDDLTAEDLTDAVDEGIRRGGAAVLAAQEAARAADPITGPVS
jgi:hypothetical protein